MYNDFANLMSRCDGVISADVPIALREIAIAISNEEPDNFNGMNDEEAVAYLKSGETQSSKLFLAFLKVHGHRGFREFQVYRKTWRDEPIVLVKSLKVSLKYVCEKYNFLLIQTQTLLTCSDENTVEINKKTISELMSTLQTKGLSLTRKRLIQYFFLPMARKAVGKRENTKSLIIYSIDMIRQAINRLAKKMHEEGRIPEEDLLFHLTLYEIDQLFTERNPLFIMKAKQRKRVLEKMDKWVFDEINKGYQIKPRNVR